MSKPLSILITDNDTDYLATAREFLRSEDYRVYAASSAEEARHIIDTEIVHIAILDTRLKDDSDERDLSGLELAKGIDPSVYTIIQTRWPRYEDVRAALGAQLDGMPISVAFVAKQEGLAQLNETVKRVAREHVRINFSLSLNFAQGLNPAELATGPDGEGAEAGSRDGIQAEELEDLLRKLFRDYAAVTVAPFLGLADGGAPSPFLLERQRAVTLVEANRVDAEGAAETVVLKLAARARARDEWETYNAAYFDKATRPLFETYAETQRLGGAVYVPAPAPERLGNVYWDGALLAWSEAAAGARAQGIGNFRRGAAAVARCLGERLGARLTSLSDSGAGFLYGVLDASEVFPEPQMPEELPVLFLHGPAVEPEPLDRLRGELRGHSSRASGMALILSFSPPGELERLRRRLGERLVRAYAWDAVTVGQSELRALVTAESSAKELRSLILSQINIHRISPFKSVGETPDNVFFGREAELRLIARDARVASFAVIAGRRFGKTSLLGQLHRARLPSEGLHTIYHDLSLTPTLDDLRAAPIRSQRGYAHPDAPRTFGALFDAPPPADPPVLLLDEVDKAVAPDRRDGWRLFTHLRALSHLGVFRVVLSGEHTLRDALRESGSPLFNFTQEMLLGPLDYGAVEELVTRPMARMEVGFEDEAAVVRRVYDFTSGHPNVVQRLCARLVERLNRAGSRLITLSEVEAVIADPGFKETDFLGTYWDSATYLEMIITLLMSREPGRYRAADLGTLLERVAGLRPDAAEVADALERLTDIRFILRRTHGGYEFAVGAFPLVLNNTVTLEDLLRVLVAKMKYGEGAT